MDVATTRNVAGTEGRGLQCWKCSGNQFRVIYTRRARGGKLIRRRECRGCRARITTWEKMIGYG